MHRKASLSIPLVALARDQAGLLSTSQAEHHGLTARSRGTAASGAWTSHGYGVLAVAGWEPSAVSEASRRLDLARRRAWAVQLVHPAASACDDLAAELFQWDGWWDGTADRHVVPRSTSKRTGWRSRDGKPGDLIVRDGLRSTGPLRTLLDLAQHLPTDSLELAVESALRRRDVTLAELEAAVLGSPMLRVVLARRPAGEPPTESMLETLGLQVCRTVPDLGEPRRQLDVYDANGRFAGRPDFSWPDDGMFLEMLGAFHDDQPDHDLARANAIVAATGWLPVTLRWRQVVATPRTAARMLQKAMRAARRRQG